MAHDLLDMLLRLALVSSAAIVVVLLLRRPLRRFAGADAAYHSWLIVVFAMLAAALPALQLAPDLVLHVEPARKASAWIAQAGAPAPGAVNWFAPALALWAAGALTSALLLLAGQRRFVRSLGTLTARDGIRVAANANHGPALLGLWRPIVVVPSDFAQRYSEAEQRLIIAHELLHAERRDPAANAVLALLQCAFWFNPLMYIAATRFRFDQELACDAAVLARTSGQRQVYAAAMLKTQSPGAPALATCHWQSCHPLKERILQLKQTPASTARRRAGRLTIAMLACAAVLNTVAARADIAAVKGDDYEIAFQFNDRAADTPPMPIKLDQPFKANWKQKGYGWRGEFLLTPAGPDSLWLNMKITQEDGTVIEPKLLMRLGERSIYGRAQPDVPTFVVGVTVTRAARVGA